MVPTCRAHLRQTAHNEQMRRKELQALRDARKRAEEEDARMTRLLMVDLSDSAAVRCLLSWHLFRSCESMRCPS